MLVIESYVVIVDVKDLKYVLVDEDLFLLELDEVFVLYWYSNILGCVGCVVLG